MYRVLRLRSKQSLWTLMQEKSASEQNRESSTSAIALLRVRVYFDLPYFTDRSLLYLGFITVKYLSFVPFSSQSASSSP